MSSTDSLSLPSALVETLRTARRWVVFTGAGVSAESGIPTFRDALTGLWAQFDAEALATAEAFVRDPNLVWGWYEWRRAKVTQSLPNAGHLAIAALTQKAPELTLVTQNVDDLHERAGSSDVLHLHGSLHHPRCFRCAQPMDPLPSLLDLTQQEQPLAPPACPHCGGLMRPGVVWFGEMLPEQALSAAFEAAAQCDVLISVGTSGVVYPAAQIPEIAWRSGATVVHVNPQQLSVRSEREYALSGKAGDWLPVLERSLV